MFMRFIYLKNWCYQLFGSYIDRVRISTVIISYVLHICYKRNDNNNVDKYLMKHGFKIKRYGYMRNIPYPLISLV